MKTVNSINRAENVLDSRAHVLQGQGPSTMLKVEVNDAWFPLYKSLVCQAVRYLALSYTEENGQMKSFEVDKQLVARIGIFQKKYPSALQEGLEFSGEGKLFYGAWTYYPLTNSMDMTEGFRQDIRSKHGDILWGGGYQAGLFDVIELPFAPKNTNQTVFFGLKEGLMLDYRGHWFAGRQRVVPEINAPWLSCGKQKHPSGLIEDGSWMFDPKAGGMVLFDGKVTQPDGTTEEGSRIFNDNLGKMVLQQGKRTHLNGKVEEGSWAYVKELGEMRLIFGQITHAKGIMVNGQFKYEPEMHEMALTNGRSELLGLVHQGRFGLEPESDYNKPFLQEGSKIEISGARQEGTWAYIPELQCMHLVDGVLKNKQGNVLRDGTWAYGSRGTGGGMVYTPKPEGAPPRQPLMEPVQWKPKSYENTGWVPSETFKKAFNSGWLSPENARIKEEWTLKVISGTCPKGAGGRLAKQDWLRFEGVFRNLARLEIPSGIARNLLKIQPTCTDEYISKLFDFPSWKVRLLRGELVAESDTKTHKDDEGEKPQGLDVASIAPSSAEAKDIPQEEGQYEFTPLLHFSGSGSLSFRGSLNSLIQKLPKVLGVVDLPEIVEAEAWILYIADAVRRAYDPSVMQKETGPFTYREMQQALNNPIQWKWVSRMDNLRDGFKSADVGEKLSKLLDDDNLLKDMCLARVEDTGLKLSSIDRVQKAIQNAKEEMPSVKMKNAQTFKAKLVGTVKGSKEERRRRHQIIFDGVALEVRKFLLGEHAASTDISQSDIDRLFRINYHELVKNENPTPEECKKLFKFALKCYAVGIFPGDQSVAGGVPKGTNFLIALLKAQKLLEKKIMFVRSDGTLPPFFKNGKQAYVGPNDDECREFVDFLKESFGF